MGKNLRKYSFSVFILVMAFSSLTFSSEKAYADIDIFVEPNVGYTGGYTKYHIAFDAMPGSTDVSGESELEFPINSYIGGIRLNFNDLKNDKPLDLELNFRTNLTDDTGKMKDSDWFSDVLFIYSESDTEMRMWDLSAKLKYVKSLQQRELIKEHAIRVYPFIGFRWQDLSFDVSNVEQEDVLDLGYFDATVSGLVLTYDITYYITSLGVGFSYEKNKGIFELEGQFGYVYATDKDNHILRDKAAEGTVDGFEVSLLASYTYNFSSNYFLKLSAEGMMLDADGTQSQHFYSGENEGWAKDNIDLEIRSAQYLGTLGLGVTF